MSDPNDFDLSSFDNFEEPPISQEQAGELPPIPEPPRGGRNTTFIIGVVVGIIVFVLALCLVAYFLYQQTVTQVGLNATATVIAATNNAVGTELVETMTANAYTKTPTDTNTPSPTPTFTPSDTFTPSNTPTITPTPSSTVDLTETANFLLTQTAIGTFNSATQTAIAQTLDAQGTMTALAGTNQAATLTAIAEQTGPGNETPETVTATLTPQSGVAANGTLTINLNTPGAPIPIVIVTYSPTPKAKGTGMPNTGFFDDVAAGRATPAGLAVIGAATLGLLGVIVVSRRIRRG